MFLDGVVRQFFGPFVTELSGAPSVPPYLADTLPDNKTPRASCDPWRFRQFDLRASRPGANKKATSCAAVAAVPWPESGEEREHRSDCRL